MKKLLLFIPLGLLAAGVQYLLIFAQINPASDVKGGSVTVPIKTRPLDAITVERLVSDERVKAGLQPLAHSDLLQQAACAKLDHMITNDYWSHTAPDGTEPWSFIQKQGYTYTKAGENLAYGHETEDNLIRGWMSSPTHKENILGDYTESGVCTKKTEFQRNVSNVSVQMFGKP